MSRITRKSVAVLAIVVAGCGEPAVEPENENAAPGTETPTARVETTRIGLVATLSLEDLPNVRRPTTTWNTPPTLSEAFDHELAMNEESDREPGSSDGGITIPSR